MMNSTTCHTRETRGITIIEIVVGIALSLILLVALIRFLAAGYPVSKITLLQANSNETARLQLSRIAKEMRKVEPSDAGAYPLVEMLPQKIVFYSDIDSDDSAERIRYELVGTELVRGIVEPSGSPVVYDTNNETSTVIAKTIRNGSDPVFTYYNGDYPDDQTALTPVDVTEVKYIEFYLKIDADTNADPPAVDVISQVQLRNLKTNLGETTE